jgi:hypothetical protein
MLLLPWCCRSRWRVGARATGGGRRQLWSSLADKPYDLCERVGEAPEPRAQAPPSPPPPPPGHGDVSLHIILQSSSSSVISSVSN